jgi:hypothetical protein
MKYIKSFALFSLLVFFPLLSWYYLDLGLDFRKELENEIQVDGTTFKDLNPSDSLSELLTKKTTIYLTDHDQLDSEEVIKLFEQFEKTYTFQLVTEKDAYSEHYSDKFILSPDTVTPIKEDTYAYLIDTSGNVRYQYQSKDDIKKLVEHTAITIPKQPSRDIVLKRDSNGE